MKNMPSASHPLNLTSLHLEFYLCQLTSEKTLITLLLPLSSEFSRSTVNKNEDTSLNTEFHNIPLALWHSFTDQYLKSGPTRGAQRGKQDQVVLKIRSSILTRRKRRRSLTAPSPSIPHCYSGSNQLALLTINRPWTFQFLTCGERYNWYANCALSLRKYTNKAVEIRMFPGFIPRDFCRIRLLQAIPRSLLGFKLDCSIDAHGVSVWRCVILVLILKQMSSNNMENANIERERSTSRTWHIW